MVDEYTVQRDLIDIYAPAGVNGIVIYHILTGDIVNISNVNGEKLKNLLSMPISTAAVSESLNIESNEALTIITALSAKGVITASEQC